MKKIGPSFGAELAAAGLAGLPFSYGEDGSLSLDALTDDQKAAVQAVYAAHDPNVQPVVPHTESPLQFIERFSDAEQITIATAAMSNPGLRLWFDKLMAAQQVVFTDPRLSAGLDALVSAGLITAGRKSELLTP